MQNSDVASPKFLRQAMRLGCAAALLAAAVGFATAAEAQTIGARSGPGILDVRGHAGASRAHHAPVARIWRDQAGVHFGSGFARYGRPGYGRGPDRGGFGSYGLGYGGYGGGPFLYGSGYPDDAGLSAAAPQPAQPAETTVNVRTHPTYQELPVYARSAPPTLQRIVKSGRGVRVITTVYEQPRTTDVDLAPRP